VSPSPDEVSQERGKISREGLAPLSAGYSLGGGGAKLRAKTPMLLGGLGGNR